MTDRPRRLVFGEDAELYDATRPGYPDALIDELVRLAGDEREALEVGAGTGKATRQLAERGIAVLAIEPDAAMAAIARRATAGTGRVEVVESDFESFDGEGRRFGLVYAAQSWHWVDEATGAVRARALLRLGGWLAAFWNRPMWDRCSLRDPLAAAYDAVAPQLKAMNPARVGGDPLNPVEAHDSTAPDVWRRVTHDAGFTALEVRDYPWTAKYETRAYVDLLRTHSGVRVLDDATRERLLAGVAAAIDAHGGVLTLPMRTLTALARAA